MINVLQSISKKMYLYYCAAAFVCISLMLPITGCERYKQKQAARERRLDYLRSVIDSSRTAHDARNDSLRRAVADSAKADSIKNALPRRTKP